MKVGASELVNLVGLEVVCLFLLLKSICIFGFIDPFVFIESFEFVDPYESTKPLLFKPVEPLTLTFLLADARRSDSSFRLFSRASCTASNRCTRGPTILTIAIITRNTITNHIAYCAYRAVVCERNSFSGFVNLGVICHFHNVIVYML